MALGLQRYWGWFLVWGIVLLILGTAAICLPLATAFAIEILLGCIFVARGIVELIHAVRSRKVGGFVVSLLTAILFIAVGALMLVYPLKGVVALTLILAALFMVEGVFRMILAVQLRPVANWGWVLLSGILSIAIAVLIWSGWPSDAVWAVGLLVGINMIFCGWAMAMFSIALRSAK